MEVLLKGLTQRTATIISLFQLTSRGEGAERGLSRHCHITEVLSYGRWVVRTGPEVFQHLREEEQA